MDLEIICGLPLPNQPQALIPPFKLLVHNWPGIENALKSLQDQLKAMTTGEQGSRREAGRTPKNDAEDANKLSKEKLTLRIKHLKILVDFIKTDLAHLIGLRLNIRDATLDSITSEELYHLYAPGDLIINRKSKVDHLHQVYAVTGGRTRLGRTFGVGNGMGDEADDSPDSGNGTWTDVVIDCFRMRWDGLQIGPFRLTHRIRHYVGERKITDLDFYPVRFRGNSEEICKALEARGKRVLECHGHMKYDGLTVDATGQQPLLENSYFSRAEPPALTYESITGVSQGGKEIEGDVYIDMKTYHQTLQQELRIFEKLRRARPSVREVTENPRGFERNGDYHTGDHDVDEAKSDDFMNRYFHLISPKTPEELEEKPACLALLSRAVPAYEFRSRGWIWIDITKIEPIDKSDKTRTRGWKDLVIDIKYRRLLESLVNNHASPAEQRRIQTKIGEGTPTAQIDLIQGTGKTSTAEAIAAYTGKPLYAITCGDIGLDADEVEEKLLMHTRLAEKWGCVLLLDEADVFLARRGWNDVKRNALVSVFLRRLEYYSGILFLTTNIVGLIDEAFKSRIHVALRYKTINEDTTKRIWHNLLRRIKRDNQLSDVKITFDDEELLEFAMEHYDEHQDDETTWNARQIRNAFSTAIAMGQFDRLERIRQEGLTPDEARASGDKSLGMIRLTKRNFLRIANISDDFEHYINSVRGADTENARLNQQRDDSYLQERAPPRKKYNRTAYLDDDYAPSPGGRRRGYQGSSQPSRPAYKGKSAARKPTNWDEDDARDPEVDEDQHDSDRGRDGCDETAEDFPRTKRIHGRID
ncbi:AAA family ATPase [Apiospora kogelbergensis]|uniref:AAA family ATPase n=1 Tax=Apiospora kogelbergensis TaxID=1337665 RepID=A0AAW0QBX8_9PEZI